MDLQLLKQQQNKQLPKPKPEINLNKTIKGYTMTFQEQDQSNLSLALELHCKNDCKLPDKIFIIFEDTTKPEKSRRILAHHFYPFLSVNKKEPTIKTYGTKPIVLTLDQYDNLRKNMNLRVTFTTDNVSDSPAIS